MSPEDFQAIQRVANIPNWIYKYYKKADPLRASIVDDCRAIVSGKEKPVNERIKISYLKNDPSVRKLANMPEDTYQLFKATDQIRAALVEMCRAIMGKTA